jgi:hypothetical protein
MLNVANNPGLVQTLKTEISHDVTRINNRLKAELDVQMQTTLSRIDAADGKVQAIHTMIADLRYGMHSDFKKIENMIGNKEN